ncbi:hypothetical protein ABZS77_03270 [Micromonospora sp. NPDC005298]|uniref:hypothetical protein n=1 Tax=Micromonospora sp. NPDC005298 TaxID=3156873 RepID=UPI0033BCA05F
MSQHLGRRLLGAGLALLTAAAAVAATPVAASAAGRADLRLDLTTVSSSALIRPDHAEVVVRATVDNIGAAGVNDVKVSFRLPAGSSIVGGPAWRCDHTTFECVHIYGPVPAGGSAEPLQIYLGLPLGPAGTVATIGATVSTTAREVTRTNNTDQVRVTYAHNADLDLLPGPDTGVWGETDVPLEGGPIEPMFTVKNVGTATARDLRLVIDRPAGVTLDGAPSGAGWACDLASTPLVCTAGPLAPDTTTALTVPMRAAAGTDGERFGVRGRVTTSSTEWLTDSNNETDVLYRYVGPGPVDATDIAVTNVVLLDDQVVAGDTVPVGVVVENLSDQPAENVRVRLTLAPTVRPTAGGGAGNPDWACAPGQEAGTGVWYWECQRDAVYRGEYHYLPLDVTVGAGTPAGQLTFTAGVISTNPDTDQANNSRSATTSYLPQGSVRGTGWYDEDRDGQRDAGEPLIGYEPPVNRLTFIPEGESPIEAPTSGFSIYGGYDRALPPGRYVVRAGLTYGWLPTTPDVGDDATDSDVTLVPESPYNAPYGDSAVIEVVDGGVVTIDVGVVPAT